METIKYPSDFILKISSIKNREGEELDLETDKINISFTFKGDGAEIYEAFYGGIDGENKNCYTEYIDVDDGGVMTTKKTLFVKFENYNIFGDIKWKVDTAIEDTHFTDNKWNVFGCYRSMNLKISKCDI